MLVRMNQKLMFYTVPKSDKHDLHTFTPRKFHGGDEITVSCDQHNTINNPLAGKPGNIKANLHVYPLLLHIGLEVFSLYPSLRFCDLARGMLLDSPAIKTDLAGAICNIVLQ